MLKYLDMFKFCSICENTKDEHSLGDRQNLLRSTNDTPQGGTHDLSGMPNQTPQAIIEVSDPNRSSTTKI